MSPLYFVEAEAELQEKQAAAFRAVAGGGDGGGRGPGAGGRYRGLQCFNCSGWGHVSTNCDKPSVVCDKCGKRGHQAVRCETHWSRIGGGGRGGGNPPRGKGPEGPRAIGFMVRKAGYMDALLRHAPPTEAEGARVLRAGALEPRQGAAVVDLYLDTCASEHCFKDKALFRGLLSPCGPVEVANKELALSLIHI